MKNIDETLEHDKKVLSEREDWKLIKIYQRKNSKH